MERLRLLRELDTRSDLPAALKGELKALLPTVTEWADGKSRATVDDSRAAENGYLCRFINSRVQPSDSGSPVYPAEPAADSLLRPIWALYRGRMLIWITIQNSSLGRVKETRERYYGEARRLLQEASKAFPDNKVIGMYLGRQIPWPHRNAPDPKAPAWANLQREGLERLSDIVRWWIAERQLPDGQFGGGWGDDVEMWRWWVPVLIAFEDPVIIEAQARTSNGIFMRPHLKEGFTTRLSDVEHTNEDTTDTISPMMHLRPDEPLWQDRALKLTEYMRDRWVGRNDRGFTQFKSIYFSLDQVDETPRRAFDTVYHTAIVQPSLLYWQRTADPKLTALFTDWLKVWIDAAAREENGKPAGVLPSTISWPAGKINVPVEGGTSWWQPFPLNHNDALYNWPSVGQYMTSTLLLAWHITRDDQYLAPLRSMAAYVRKHGSRGSAPEPGTPSWIADQTKRILGDTLAKYRFLSGDRQYDDLLEQGATGYAKFRLTGDRSPLTDGLERNARAFRSNWEGYTSEMRWTDRVILFTNNFLRYLPEPAPPLPAPELLYACATGDPGTPLFFPLNAVRWRTPPQDIAALVTESSASSFSAEVFHFGDLPRKMAAEFLLLQPGAYEVAVSWQTSDGAPERRVSKFEATGPRTNVSLEVPARRLCTVVVTAAGAR